MSTHNICFHGEIRKIICGYPLLSVAMYLYYSGRYIRANGTYPGQILHSAATDQVLHCLPVRRSFKRHQLGGSCQSLVKECAQHWLTA